MAKRSDKQADPARGDRSERRRRRIARGGGRAAAGSAKSVRPTQKFGYFFAHKRAPGASSDLVVAFSPSDRFALYHHDFGRDVLFIADRSRTYYLRNASALAAEIMKTVGQGGYERVLFFGTSKGGFGALSIARICARRRPDRVFHALVLSPQTRLHPPNHDLLFASYQRLRKAAGRRQALGKRLRDFGDATEIGSLPNVVVEIVYASQARVDRAEAHAVRGPNVRHRAVEGGAHGTAFFFMSHGLSPENLRARIMHAYRRLDDEDLVQTRPQNIDEMIADVMAATKTQPTLNDLMSDIMARRPVAPDRLLSLAGLAFSVMRARMWAEALRFRLVGGALLVAGAPLDLVETLSLVSDSL